MAIHNRYTDDDLDQLRTNRLALDDAIISLEPLIKKAAKSLGFARENHYHAGMEFEDAIQVGRIAIWKWLPQFDPDKAEKGKSSIIGYLWTKIRNEIRDEVRRNQWMPASRHHGPAKIVHVDLSSEYHLQDGAADGFTWIANSNRSYNGWNEEARYLNFRPLTEDDPTALQAANEEWCARMDEVVKGWDYKRRNIYEGTMKHDDTWGSGRKGERRYEALGISDSRATQLRQDIRKKLAAVVH